MSQERGNPLLKNWTASHALPPFKEIKATDFVDAFQRAFDDHAKEVDVIAACEDPPNFANTVEPFDEAGTLLSNVSNVFSTLTSSVTNPELQEVEREMAPLLAAHSSKISMHQGYFERLACVHAARASAGLNPEQLRLTERLYLDGVRAGAKLNSEEQKHMASLMQEMAKKLTAFAQNLLADEDETVLQLSKDEMKGCPEDLIAAARAAASERGLQGDDDHIITMSRSLVEPFLTFADNRDLREKAWKLWTQRGELSPERDNKALGVAILRLRSEQAALLGYDSFGAYKSADSMAGSPEKVMELLEKVWPRACDAAAREEAELVAAGVPEDGLKAWDWRYYAEKVRVEKYSFDDAELKPYFSLENVTNAMFDCANKLYGLTFQANADLPVFHQDATAYEVHSKAGQLVAIFIADNFSRKGKSGGAWMSELRTQSKGVLPIVTNNNNFNKPAGGKPCLLTMDDARTCFHEFGHGLHGMLSNVNYRGLAGTNVLRDWVELPSQLMEHWIQHPDVLRAHCKHIETGEPIPDELLEKLKASQQFNAGFDAVEYTSCALVDQALHALPQSELDNLDLGQFEQATLARLGMPKAIVMRHRLPHFAHIFATSGYAAGYYVYLWAETLDADAFESFKEAGDPFDPQVAQKALEFIYQCGNAIEPGEAFRKFRGRDPDIEAMLRKKGLAAAK